MTAIAAVAVAVPPEQPSPADFPVRVLIAFLTPAKPIVAPKVSASFDDGSTWRVSGATPGLQPRPAVQRLRSTAVDAAGNESTGSSSVPTS